MRAVPDGQWREYAEEVWMEFTKRSEQPERVMSPREWWLLRGWLLAGVPLRVVLQAMGEVKGRAASLRYYEGAVRDEWERQRLATGGTR